MNNFTSRINLNHIFYKTIKKINKITVIWLLKLNTGFIDLFQQVSSQGFNIKLLFITSMFFFCVFFIFNSFIKGFIRWDFKQTSSIIFVKQCSIIIHFWIFIAA